MVMHMLDELLGVVLWPGDTIIDWLLTAHPRLAMWLGVGADSIGGLTSALVSLLVGWVLFTVMANLMLLGVRLWERWYTRPVNADKDSE
jgi:hypothetical protein